MNAGQGGAYAPHCGTRRRQGRDASLIRSHPLVGPGLSGMVAPDRYTTAPHPHGTHAQHAAWMYTPAVATAAQAWKLQRASRFMCWDPAPKKRSSSNRGKIVHHHRVHAGIVASQAVMRTQTHYPVLSRPPAQCRVPGKSRPRRPRLWHKSTEATHATTASTPKICTCRDARPWQQTT